LIIWVNKPRNTERRRSRSTAIIKRMMINKVAYQLNTAPSVDVHMFRLNLEAVIRPVKIHTLRSYFVLFLVMEHRWNEIDRGNPKYSGKNLSQCHFVHYKSHMD
jgi:hypothetical protein